MTYGERSTTPRDEHNQNYGSDEQAGFLSVESVGYAVCQEYQLQNYEKKFLFQRL